MAIYKTKLEKLQIRHRQALTVKDYILFNPVNYKTNTRGYWIDNAGKVYKDYIKLDKHASWACVKAQAVKLCKDKSQQCIFVKGLRARYIINPQGKVSNIFKGKRIIPLHSKADIRQAIRQYKAGVTIYKDLKGYRTEVYI